MMNKPINFRFVVIIGSCTLLFACNKAPSFAELCDEHPKICNEFKEDYWCKTERIAVGFSNLAHQKKPEDLQKIDQLMSYENYAQCMVHASKIEHNKFKEKQGMRINNAVNANKRIKEISDSTLNSNHPRLLYYHWSRYLNKDALQKFLALENTKELETPNLQLNLATYYAKIDQSKTLNLLYHALELTDVDEPIDTEIFKSISTIFAEKKEYKKVYIWSKVLTSYSPDDKTINTLSLNKYAQAFNLDHEFLDRVASKILDTILQGEFIKP